MSGDVEQTVADLTIQFWLSEAAAVDTLSGARAHLGRLAGAAAAAELSALSRAARKMRYLLAQKDCDENFAIGSVRRFLARVADDGATCGRLSRSNRALTWVHPELKERVERTLIRSIYLSTVLEVDRMIQGSNLDDRELEEAL